MSSAFLDWWLMARIRSIEERHRNLRRRLVANAIRGQSAAQTLQSIDDDLRRVALVVRGVTELCVAKGIFTREELEAALLEVDLADGVGDARLDPKVCKPGETKLAELEPADASAKPIVRKKRPGRR
jgi:hypothetical protein